MAYTIDMIFVQGFRVTLSASGVKRHPKAEIVHGQYLFLSRILRMEHIKKTWILTISNLE